MFQNLTCHGSYLPEEWLYLQKIWNHFMKWESNAKHRFLNFLHVEMNANCMWSCFLLKSIILPQVSLSDREWGDQQGSAEEKMICSGKSCVLFKEKLSRNVKKVGAISSLHVCNTFYSIKPSCQIMHELSYLLLFCIVLFCLVLCVAYFISHWLQGISWRLFF